MTRSIFSSCKALFLAVILAISCMFSTHSAFADEGDSREVSPAYVLFSKTMQGTEFAVVVSSDDGSLMVARYDCADDAAMPLRLKLEEKDGRMTIQPFEGLLTSRCSDGNREFVSLEDGGSECESVECFLLEKDDGTVSIECGSSDFWTVDGPSGCIVLSDEDKEASQAFILCEVGSSGRNAAQASFDEGEPQSEMLDEGALLYADAYGDGVEDDASFEEPGGESSYYEDNVEDPEDVASEGDEEAIDEDLLSSDEDQYDSDQESESSDLLDAGDSTLIGMMKVVSLCAGVITLTLIVSAVFVRRKPTGVSDCRKMR